MSTQSITMEVALGVIEAQGLSAFEVSELLDRRRILRALKMFGWNQCATAAYLKMHRNTMSRRIKELNLSQDEPETKRVYRPRGMKAETCRSNGLDREITPLVATLRLKQYEVSSRRARDRESTRRKKDAAKTEAVNAMLAASERISELDRLRRA